jgi:hypothetical protein
MWCNSDLGRGKPHSQQQKQNKTKQKKKKHGEIKTATGEKATWKPGCI